MRIRFSRLPSIALCLLPLALLASAARAVVGASNDGAGFGEKIVMVLKGDKSRAGFCSGVVVRQNVVLTAAHCVGDAAHTMIHFRAPDGAPVLSPVHRLAVHPAYRANAIRTRERSVDLALVELAEDLPSDFQPATLATASEAAPGQSFRVAGYGLTREGDAHSAGQLRIADLTLRAPVSDILLWLEDPSHAGTGACTGDSGGPIFEADGRTVAGIIDWTGGMPPNKCGALTQGAKIGPQKGWIDSVLETWQGR
ncbi:S1 family peptidase [Methylovirgula sp. 4M-Z18]|uniref:S1 family peptidase n=1 Tax=Methylovirgula sp. 4M-Z18 TaxID=2293567 RepID=UPI000E2F2EA5|nr:trypsin-like serine protease [Methylovirgula sp. 4M-Z18]RFB76313.1 S1 family peptidase [Methylovirgula sp. 4M-Z18]